MINPYIIRKYSAIIMTGFISVILFYVGLIYYNLIGGICFLIVGIILMTIVSNLLLKNPFQQVLEGQGIMAVNADSTGLISPFIMSVQQPYMLGKVKGQDVYDVFDRNAVFSFTAPEQLNKPARVITKDFIKNIIAQLDNQAAQEINITLSKIKDEKKREKEQEKLLQQYSINREKYLDKLNIYEGGILLALPKAQLNESRMVFNQFPLIVYNDIIKSVLTKGFLSEKESYALAKHTLLFLNRKAEELNNSMRNFGRYIVETGLKPKSNNMVKYGLIVVIVIFIILALLFAPSLIKTLSGATESVGAATDIAKNSISTIG